MNAAAILAALPQALLNAEGKPAIWWLLTVLVLAIAFLLVLILALRLQAFVALLLTSTMVAILSGMDLSMISGSIIKGMGEALGMLAVIVGLGSIFGQVLEYSGGAQSLATSLHRTFGEKRAHWAMILVGFLISIPVFFDVALVILAPILVAMARNSGKSILRYGLPLAAAMAVTHACIPPTPGPILVALNLGATLGDMILWGFIVGFPTAVIAGLVGAKMGEKVVVPIPRIFAEAAAAPQNANKKPVPAFEVIVLILLPIVLILAQSIVKVDLDAETAAFKTLQTELSSPEGQALSAAERDNRVNQLSETFTRIDREGQPVTWVQLILFLGHPITALLLTTLVTLYLLGTLRGVDRDTLMELSTQSLGPAGIIILVTGAGGVFKTILVDSGVGNALAQVFTSLDAPLIFLAFLLTVIIRVTQGSATVAMIGGSALMAGAVEAAGLGGADRALMGVAIACGATMASHVNDSGFWVVKNYLGMTEKQCLSTWSVLTCIVSVVGFVLAAVLSIFV